MTTSLAGVNADALATLDLFDRAVAPLRHFTRIRADVQNDLKLATGLHPLAVRDELRAALAIAREGLPYQLAIHARTIFETTTRMRWLHADPTRATRFLTSEPFERFWLAKTYPRVRERLAYDEVIRACEDAIRRDPALATLGTSTAEKPDYLAIRKALQLPKIGQMLVDLSEDPSAYAERYHVPSIASHGSIAYLRNFHVGNNPDGTAIVDTTSTPGSLEAWVFDMLRTIPYLFGFAVALGGIVSADVEAFVARLDALAQRLARALQPAIDATPGMRPRRDGARV